MKKGTIYVTLSYVLWGLLPVFWKLLADVDSFYVLACRVVFSLVVSAALLPLLGEARRAKDALKDKRLVGLMLCCGLLISFNWGVLIYCVAAERVLDVSLAYYINPLLAILVGFICFREKLSAAQWIACAIAAAGVAAPMVMAGEFPILAVLCGLSFAVYGAVKKVADIPGELSTFMETLLVVPFAIAFIIYCEANGGPIASGQLSGWRLLLLPAAGAVTFLPVYLYSAGIRTTSMGLSGVLMYINPTLQLLIGLLYGETLGTDMLVTFACVWIATAIYLISGAKSRKRAANAALEE
ncbi:MAG TPA: EamA family transporter RarD [Candidatus Scatomorpha merdipullorum]|uniref:EamA family transporter RarD n=1 Tax=Candidatus Scatomorpha merdipullorum TaxID=2840927 RepID=A0A9D1FDP2_9FIRM|nr:EamA family transporter RarD [Candidatus Scatomorpha merdipullorum]